MARALQNRPGCADADRPIKHRRPGGAAHGGVSAPGARLLLGERRHWDSVRGAGLRRHGRTAFLAAALGLATAALEAGTRNAGVLAAEHFGIVEPFGWWRSVPGRTWSSTTGTRAPT
ncbi:MAG: hypothetical protein R2882_13200 [Gemmatimonadales bacterium]